MTARPARVIALWLIFVVAALWVVAHATYVTDLSAFLPAKPTRMQRLLVDQLREGPASKLILVALEGGDPLQRAAVSKAMADTLRREPQFSNIANGEPVTAERDQQFLFRHRYLLSPAVTPDRFTVPGLTAAFANTLDTLASSAGLMLKSLVREDPTGEFIGIVDRVTGESSRRTQSGVWVSADDSRTLLVAQTLAAGSDTDAQERALDAIEAAFHTCAAAQSREPTAITLRMSGLGVFAVAARAKIKTAATRLSLLSSVLVISVLLAAYRSPTALLLGLLPVASAALAGVAAVALGFGAVHGITLGFGVTLIGETVDYSIYFFIQSSAHWRQRLWPTIRLGVLTSIGGFASLLPSGFPGLAQLGLYSISGLIAAALVTRFILPELKPRNFVIHDVTPLGRQLERALHLFKPYRQPVLLAAGLLAAIAGATLYLHRESLWNRELSALSPVSPQDLAYDAKLRADLGTPNVLDVVVVSGANLESVLRGAERAGAALQSLIDANVIAGFDSPANYLPSLALQTARRDSLPEPQVLGDNLHQATLASNLNPARLQPFMEDVAQARRSPFLTREDLQGTSLAIGFDALILHQSDRWNALLPLHAGDIGLDLGRVQDALNRGGATDAQVLDMKMQTDALYASYLREASQLSLAGGASIVLLLVVALRSLGRVVRILVPLLLAVLTVAALLTLVGQKLTILHLVGMLLIVAVGSNYALFFDRESRADTGAAPLTLASLLIANVCTVLGFGLLSMSHVPVLEALGTTVAPGAFLALVFAAILVPPGAPRA